METGQGYMGAWTVMWNGGIWVGPPLGGILIGSIGRRHRASRGSDRAAA